MKDSRKIYFSISSPIAIDVPHFGTLTNGAREIFVLSSHDGVKWHEHQVMPEADFLEKLPEGLSNELNGKKDI